MTDPIADMLSRIRNGISADKKSVDIPASNIKVDIVRVLKDEGYIEDYREVGEGLSKKIVVDLKYTDENASVIAEIKRVSKPGLRTYVSKSLIPRVKGGMGIAILSTSKGVMTGMSARKMGIGGEILATVW
ncbi:MAG: 30S ribosomal protein S8 [Candidatus Dadabacteria bacterium]|nr:30S ribosomal protein S8 [Candidatus Dadabacteria bacterium]